LQEAVEVHQLLVVAAVAPEDIENQVELLLVVIQ
jgi:hypothetical protein